MLSEIDFWNVCGDVVETWLSDNDEFTMWIHDDDFERRDKLLSDLSAPAQTDRMEIYLIVARKKEEYKTTLSVSFMDKEGFAIEERDYPLCKSDNEYMIKCLENTDYLDEMNQLIKENRQYRADNGFIERF